MLPAIFGSSVAQINVLLGGVIASMLGVGKISLLYYSDRLMEFPLGLFGIALATVTLPYLSRQHASQSMRDFARTIDWSMRLVLLIAVPSAIGLILLAGPLVTTIFYGGAFSADDVRLTAISLQAFALGLIGFSLVKILAPAYFAREDTRTPVRIGLIALLVNFVLSVVLAWWLVSIGYSAPHAGLALAISVAALVNAWLLYRGLRRDGVMVHSSGWLAFIARLSAANAAMVAAIYYLMRPLEWWLQADVAARVFLLSGTIAAAVAVFFAMLLLAGGRLSQLRLHER
ncbi:MAG: lipid II flippase MurJ [Woeseiaceae bacterium]|nr:lipid II flippase MurJ [Woeseiaceae bacterium]